MRYLVGIDLGTTNSALAYIDLQSRPRTGALGMQTFAIPQLVAPGQMAERPLLPSFLYVPGQHDLPPGSFALPWKADAPVICGELARSHGARIPGRLVSSAKSWLCHPGVDRKAPLLPWTAPPDVQRYSPLDISAHYLRHMVEAWNYHFDKQKEKLEDQSVVLTVPASFDDVARNLTIEAAQQAQLKNVILLEEPQSAFYCWLGLSKVEEIGRMKPGMRCLVVDVGGGTSDFSIIRAAEDKGELTFIRESVGDHLLLGGDNMDLALARLAEAKLPQAGKLDAAQFGVLVQACRQAKEQLLNPKGPPAIAVTVQGRGRSVIGGSLHTSITVEDVKQAILEGFFPLTDRDAEPVRIARMGLQEMGLPYVSDPAITKHIASFLKRQLPPGESPDAILFNGGVFQPQVLRDRIIDVMRPWYETPAKPWNPLTLVNPSLDLAVAWGASYYAWLRQSGGRRIGGGIPRSYYIGVETTAAGANANSNPTARSRRSVLCVVPRRLEEGEEISLPKPQLELALGQPVLFPLYTSTVRGDDKPGDLLDVEPEQLLHLPALHTILRGGKRSGTKRVPVTLASKCTEIGTLELYCVASDGENRWRLEFNVRDIVKDVAGPSEATGEERMQDVWPEPPIQEAGALLRSVYVTPSAQTPPVQEINKQLERILGASRSDWPTSLCRRLWEFLEQVTPERVRSSQHLNRWYHLAGYCLRPGFGDSLDRYRIEQLWKMLAAPYKAGAGVTMQQVEGGADYWIMWRRIAGGLNQSYQQTLFNRARPILLPAKGKQIVRPGANELAEMWRAAAALERLDAKAKQALGDVLLRQVSNSPVPTYAFWALTRLGARILLYGPMNTVIHPEIVESWLDQIVGFEPGNDSERNAWAFCLSQLARKSGQRALDIDESRRTSVLTVLKSLKVPRQWVKMVEEIVATDDLEQSQMFGDSLPIGLRLMAGY